MTALADLLALRDADRRRARDRLAEAFTVPEPGPAEPEPVEHAAPTPVTSVPDLGLGYHGTGPARPRADGWLREMFDPPGDRPDIALVDPYYNP